MENNDMIISITKAILNRNLNDFYDNPTGGYHTVKKLQLRIKMVLLLQLKYPLDFSMILIVWLKI